jgi:hypothetical protein
MAAKKPAAGVRRTLDAGRDNGPLRVEMVQRMKQRESSRRAGLATWRRYATIVRISHGLTVAQFIQNPIRKRRHANTDLASDTPIDCHAAGCQNTAVSLLTCPGHKSFEWFCRDHVRQMEIRANGNSVGARFHHRQKGSNNASDDAPRQTIILDIVCQGLKLYWVKCQGCRRYFCVPSRIHSRLQLDIEHRHNPGAQVRGLRCQRYVAVF